MSLKSFVKQSLATIAGIAVLIGLIILYNGWHYLAVGEPRIPSVEGRWWAGYYDTKTLGRQWCVARFSKTGGDLQMALLSRSGPPDVFAVKRSSSSENFVYLTFTEQNGGVRIEAKQLYDGQRYYFGRLTAGRFRDFWKMNADISIRGQTTSMSAPEEFAIEPIDDNQLEQFWRRYVRTQPGEPSPSEANRFPTTQPQLNFLPNSNQPSS